MDVGFDLGDVADLEVLAGGGHDLHHADRAHGTLDVLVQRRLLIALRGHQQVIDVVLRAVLLEELHDRQELLALGLGGGVLRVLHVVEIATLDRVAERVPLAVLPNPRVDGCQQPWILLAHRDGQFAAGSHGHVGVHGQTGEHLLPELGEVVIRDR